MTLFMLFAGLGVVIYTGMAYAASTSAGVSGAHAAFGLEFALFVSLSVFLAVGMLFLASRVLRERSLSLDSVSTWRARHLFIVAVIFLACAGVVLIAATRVPEDALSRAGHGGTESTGMTAEANLRQPNLSRAAVAVGNSGRAAAAGMKLFQERGCIGCHRPDGTGVGPMLQGLFGRPVQEQSYGTEIVDEAYVRESILNPSATVAMGFAPVMPTFAGRLTEEELQALIEYLRSLTASPRVQARQQRAVTCDECDEKEDNTVRIPWEEFGWPDANEPGPQTEDSIERGFRGPEPVDDELGRSESFDPDNVGDIADEGPGHRG